MPEAADPAVKLFGRKTRLLDSQSAREGAGVPFSSPSGVGEVEDACGEVGKAEVKVIIRETMEKADHSERDASSSLQCGSEDASQATKQDERATEDPKIEEQTDGYGHGTVLKKPDKLLPCPRCNSMNTKFCYYNNYNVNQPRHFCKNCQRYWTAGGTMRNVPVGAGRRKNKHSASYYRHMSISSDAVSSSRLNSTASINDPVHVPGPSVATMLVKNDGSTLNLVAEESTASALSMNEQKRNAEMAPTSCGENGDEPSCASSLTALNASGDDSPDNAAHIGHSCNGLIPIHYVQCYAGLPWTYPLRPGWNNVAPVAATGQENGNTNPVAWNPPPIVTPPFCSPTIPFPCVPAFFWGCMSGYPNEMWNVPWVGPNCSSPFSSVSNSGCSGLGKHCRDALPPEEEKTEKSLWVPKTLRIDDPDEAAKSSIWTTLGIKPDTTTKKGGIFGGFQSKTENKDQYSDGKQFHQANPAALSRYQTFQENT